MSEKEESMIHVREREESMNTEREEPEFLIDRRAQLLEREDSPDFYEMKIS